MRSLFAVMVLLLAGCALDPVPLEGRVCRTYLDCLAAQGYYCQPTDAADGTDGGNAGICISVSALDAGVDAAHPFSDANVDASRDANVDARVDADVDADVDGGMDAGVDAGMDAEIDAGTDAEVDGGSDAAVDDAGTDAAMDDADVDAEVDAGADAG